MRRNEKIEEDYFWTFYRQFRTEKSRELDAIIAFGWIHVYLRTIIAQKCIKMNQLKTGKFVMI